VEELIKSIKKFEQQADIIEPDAGRRRQLLSAVNDYTEKFLENLPDRPAYIANDEMGKGIYDSPISEQGMGIDEVLQIYKENVDEQGLSPVSGRFFGYIPPCSMYYSALGDYMAAIMDEFTGDFSNCPGAVRMEYQLVRWMADLVGYPKTAKGVLVSGGSIATLTCMVTAREAHGIKARDYENVVVYYSKLTHHCVNKALHIAGMTDCVRHEVDTDERFRMAPVALTDAIEEDKAKGLTPWLLVGSSGTTDLGNVDQLDKLGTIAKENGLWYHVDGAYGGFFIMTDLVRDRFNGIEMSDSVVMNPHKALHTPFGLGAAIVREGEKLYKAHFYTAKGSAFPGYVK